MTYLSNQIRAMSFNRVVRNINHAVEEKQSGWPYEAGAFFYWFVVAVSFSRTFSALLRPFSRVGKVSFRYFFSSLF